MVFGEDTLKRELFSISHFASILYAKHLASKHMIDLVFLQGSLL